MEVIGLCYRCEHRAKWHETKGESQPRCECGDIYKAVWSCYMYSPVKPLLIKRAKGDRRPMFSGWLFSSRLNAVGVDDSMVLTAGKARKAYRLYWTPLKNPESR